MRKLHWKMSYKCFSALKQKFGTGNRTYSWIENGFTKRRNCSCTMYCWFCSHFPHFPLKFPLIFSPFTIRSFTKTLSVEIKTETKALLPAKQQQKMLLNSIIFPSGTLAILMICLYKCSRIHHYPFRKQSSAKTPSNCALIFHICWWFCCCWCIFCARDERAPLKLLRFSDAFHVNMMSNAPVLKLMHHLHRYCFDWKGFLKLQWKCWCVFTFKISVLLINALVLLIQGVHLQWKEFRAKE